jgi:hypothetical protein
MTTLKIPTTLSHTPILTVENYETIDGNNAGDSDAKGLSIGIAQWNAAGKTELSAKVWRHSGNRWSRQSEELPLHRVLDLATLICTAIDYAKNKDAVNYKQAAGFDVSPADYENSEIKRLLGVMTTELKVNDDQLFKCIDRLTTAIEKIDVQGKKKA